MRPAFLPLALLGSALASVAGCAAPPHRHAVSFEMAADSVAVPMNQVEGRILLDVVVDGKGPFPFVLDTGAQGSVMDLSFAREQGLELGQDITVQSPGGRGRSGNLVGIKRLAIGGIVFKGMSFVAFDGLPFAHAASPPKGVLSPYAWSGLLVSIDYPGRRIVFLRGALPEPDDREVFGWQAGLRLPEFPATVAGQAVTLQLDTGAAGGLSLPVALAGKLPLEGPLTDMGYAKTVDQVKPVRGATLHGRFDIGRYTLDRPTIRFVDLARGIGSLGSSVLGQFVVTVDPANARLRLAGPTEGRLRELAERKPHYGLQFEALDSSPIRVAVVDAGSPAENVGVLPQDEIVRMNGRPIENLKPDERLEALRDSPLELTVRRNGDEQVVNLTLK